MRRDFAGIIAFISRNPNEVVAGNIREAPRAHLISASLESHIFLSVPESGTLLKRFSAEEIASKIKCYSYIHNIYYWVEGER